MLPTFYVLHNRLTKNSNSTAKNQRLTVQGIHHRVPRAAHLVEATNQHIRLTALDSTAIQNITALLFNKKKTAVVNRNYFTFEIQL